MKIIQVYNETKRIVLLERAGMADTFFLRLKGLLGWKELSPGEGLVIKPCNAVHTLGMAFSIDVAFVDAENRICHIITKMPPNKFGKTIKKARYVVEGSAGLFSASETGLGDLIEIVDV